MNSSLIRKDIDLLMIMDEIYCFVIEVCKRERGGGEYEYLSDCVISE